VSPVLIGDSSAAILVVALAGDRARSCQLVVVAITGVQYICQHFNDRDPDYLLLLSSGTRRRNRYNRLIIEGSWNRTVNTMYRIHWYCTINSYNTYELVPALHDTTK
jgi:hypothetical protein